MANSKKQPQKQIETEHLIECPFYKQQMIYLQITGQLFLYIFRLFLC